MADEQPNRFFVPMQAAIAFRHVIGTLDARPFRPGLGGWKRTPLPTRKPRTPPHDCAIYPSEEVFSL